MTLKALLTIQRAWADRRWPGCERDRLSSLDQSFFRPLSQDAIKEYSAGNGDELGIRSKKPRVQSLRSSSALVCNFFEPWRGTNLSPLTKALGFQDEFLSFQFEAKCPHGLRGTPPNLDVLLTRRTGGPAGIESKFAEPYGRHRERKPIDGKYFSNGRKRWSELGLPQCQQLAVSIGKTERYTRLDAGQLLKHILGLGRRYKPYPVSLLYLWFDVGSDEADEHRIEVTRFAASVDGAVDFRVATYQHVFAQLRDDAEPQSGYRAYLRDRYFAA
jgi:hypothetical protein